MTLRIGKWQPRIDVSVVLSRLSLGNLEGYDSTYCNLLVTYVAEKVFEKKGLSSTNISYQSIEIIFIQRDDVIRGPIYKAELVCLLRCSASDLGPLPRSELISSPDIVATAFRKANEVCVPGDGTPNRDTAAAADEAVDADDLVGWNAAVTYAVVRPRIGSRLLLS